MKTKRIIIEIPADEFTDFSHIADRHIVHPTKMAEAVIRTFIKNMKEKLYPVITDLNKEQVSQPTNTDAVKTDTK
jgi:hypothetical protein